MTVQEFIIYITEKEIQALNQAADSLPEDKLDWKPAPGARSALDQLQEAATAMQAFVSDLKAQKVTFDEERMKTWMNSRSQLTSREQINAAFDEGMNLFREYINALDPAEFNNIVEVPMPGEWRVANLAYYHPWNLAYHVGQINYIKSLLD